MSRIVKPMAWLAGGLGLAAASYAAYTGSTWLRYGKGPPAGRGHADALLDRFMPGYDVAEHHHVRVEAPAETTLDAACDQELFRLPLVRAIFKAREIVLGARRDNRPRPHGLLAEVLAMGWGVLAEEPGREIVVGAVTRPWEPNVTFRAIPPEAFEAFDEPGYVKIAWTLRADPIGRGASMFRTETRVATTDAMAWARFRTYWACFSPGIVLIRRLSLGPLKREAERRARETDAPREG